MEDYFTQEGVYFFSAAPIPQKSGGRMIAEIKAIVDTIKIAVEGVKSFRNKKIKTDVALDLLRIYFILMDLARDGLELLNSAGEDPAKTIKNLPSEDAENILADWGVIVRRQGARLVLLNDKLIKQNVLALVDPLLKDRLQKLVGSKFNRVQTLQSIAAGIVMYSIFGGIFRPIQLIDVIRSVYKAQRNGSIDVFAARGEIVKLEEALEAYRLVCCRLLSNEEIMILTEKARQEICEMSPKIKT